MKLRSFVLLSAFVLPVPTIQTVLAQDASTLSSQSETFQVKEKTEVPNLTLDPGSYSIRIKDHLQDRAILQITGKSNRVLSTFLAVPASTMANAPVGPILYGAGPKGKAALKGYAFPGGTAVEFVYPKNDAVSLAVANGTRIMAIDPASEGKVPAPKLNQTDMQMVSLWMLEPARVGPDAKPTISASHYQAPAPVQSAPAQPAPAQVATATPEPQPAPQPVSQTTPAQPAPINQADNAAPVTPPAPARVASRRQRPVEVARNDVPAPPVRTHTRPANVTALPHTGSDLPWVALAGCASLLAAFSLRLRRLGSRA